MGSFYRISTSYGNVVGQKICIEEVQKRPKIGSQLVELGMPPVSIFGSRFLLGGEKDHVTLDEFGDRRILEVFTTIMIRLG